MVTSLSPMETASLCVWILILTVIIYLWSRTKSSGHERGKPLPGPGLREGLQVFLQGSLNNRLHLYLPAWAAKFGDIWQVNLVIRKTIFINTAEVFRRLVKSREFREFTNDRPQTYVATQYFPGSKNIVFSRYDASTQERRRILHQALKFYGEGREYVESAILSGLRDLAAVLDTSETVEISVELRNFVAKLLIFLLTGDPADATQENVDLIKNYTDNVDRMFVNENEILLQPFPWLRFIPGLRFKKLHNDFVTSRQAMENFYFYSLKERFNSGHTKGMLCELFALQEAGLEDGTEFVDDATIKGLLSDLVVGGYSTTSSTLSCLFLHLVKYPQLQDCIYKEIQEVVGASTPSFNHKSRMPYTEAALLETLRFSSILPLLVPHLLRKDVIFDGYLLPKSSILFMNSWSQHHNAELWDDPYAFKPDRFLDTNGEILAMDHPIRQQLVPFGTGPRMCPGEMFARSRAFLVIIYLLKQFEFVQDDQGPSLPTVDPREYKGRAILSPANFTCKVLRRTI